MTSKIMSIKEKAFCENYVLLGNATEAYKQAGYVCKNESVASSGATKLLARQKVKDYIDELMAEHKSDMIACQEEVLQFLTSTMRNEEEHTKERVRCAELLGKRYALFTEKVQVDTQATITIIDDID